MISFVAGIVYVNSLAQNESGTAYISLTDIMVAMRQSPLIWPLLIYNFLSMIGTAILFFYHILYVLPTLTSTQEIIKN